MINSSCGNCGAAEHFSKDVTASPGVMARSLLPISPFRDPRYTIVVCGNCGLTRWFVPKEFLRDVRESFERADSSENGQLHTPP